MTYNGKYNFKTKLGREPYQSEVAMVDRIADFAEAAFNSGIGIIVWWPVKNYVSGNAIVHLEKTVDDFYFNGKNITSFNNKLPGDRTLTSDVMNILKDRGFSTCYDYHFHKIEGSLEGSWTESMLIYEMK